MRSSIFSKTSRTFFMLIAVFFLLSTLAIAKPITIKIGHCNAPGKTDPYHLTATYFAEALEEIAPGQFKVQIFPARQLGDEKEMIEGIGFGTIDMGVITNSPISRISEPFQVNDMPFIYPNEEHAHKILDGPVGQKLLATLASKNIIGLGFAEGGFRQMINNVRPVEKAGDVSGIKWRVMPNPVYIEMFRSLGGNAVPMPWGEVFTELRQRGLKGVGWVISDGHEGIQAAVAKHFTGASWQRCWTHFMRNLLAKTSHKHKDALSKDIIAARKFDDVKICLAEAERVATRWEGRYPRAAKQIRTQFEETLAVHGLPSVHRRRVYTTNMVERLNREVKRRTRVVGIFPNDASCERW